MALTSTQKAYTTARAFAARAGSARAAYTPTCTDCVTPAGVDVCPGLTQDEVDRYPCHKRQEFSTYTHTPELR